MTLNEIKEKIENAIMKTYQTSIESHSNNWFGAHITPEGHIYYDEEIDEFSIPAPVWEGKHKTICKFRGEISILPENKEEREEIIETAGSVEDAEEWIVSDWVNIYRDEYMAEEYGDTIDELAEWVFSNVCC